MVILNSVSMLLPRRTSLNSRYSVNVLVYNRNLNTEDCTIAYYDYKNSNWCVASIANAEYNVGEYPYWCYIPVFTDKPLAPVIDGG